MGTTSVRSIGRTARSMIARASSSAMVFPNGRIFDVTASTPNSQLAISQLPVQLPNYQLPTTNTQRPTLTPTPTPKPNSNGTSPGIGSLRPGSEEFDVLDLEVGSWALGVGSWE